MLRSWLGRYTLSCLHYDEPVLSLPTLCVSRFVFQPGQLQPMAVQEYACLW